MQYNIIPFAKYIGILGLFFALFISAGLIIHLDKNIFQEEDKNNTLPDAFMKNVLITQMNENGTLSSRLYSPHVYHFPHNNTAEFTKLHYILYQEKQSPWILTSNYGRTDTQFTKIDLWENVELSQSAGLHNKSHQLNTNTLTLFPKIHYAETNQLVHMQDPSTQLTAKGLQAYFQEERIILLSNVKGIYENTKSS